MAEWVEQQTGRLKGLWVKKYPSFYLTVIPTMIDDRLRWEWHCSISPISIKTAPGHHSFTPKSAMSEADAAMEGIYFALNAELFSEPGKV